MNTKKFKKNFFLNNKLAKNTLLYTISSYINKIIPFILLTIITRYLSTEEYGIASMIIVSGQIVAPFIMLGCSTAFIRKFIEKDDENNSCYLFNGLIIMVISGMAISFICILLKNQIQDITAIPEKYLVNLIVISVSNVFYDTCLAIIEAKEKPKRFLALQVGFSIFNAVLSILMVVVINLGLNGYIYSLSIIALFKFIVAIKVMIKEIGLVFEFNIQYIKDIIFAFGLPMIPTQLKGTILTYSDRLFITNMMTLSSTGVYSIGSQFAQPIEILCQSFNLAFVPWLYKKLNENNNEIKSKIVIFTYIYDLFFLIGSIIWSFFVQTFLKFLVGESFVEGKIYVLWLSLGYAFHAMQMMVVNYIYYMKKVNLYSIVTIIILSLNLVLNYIFINKNGTVGAAHATMIVNLLSFLFTWFLAAYVYKMPWFLFSNREKTNKDK